MLLTRRSFVKSCTAALATINLPSTEVLVEIVGKPLPSAGLLALEVGDFPERFIRPAMEALAKSIDHEVMELLAQQDWSKINNYRSTKILDKSQ